jgi:hypothetical protein
MKPVPARQRRQAHRQRKALGRALHQVKGMRPSFLRARRWGRYPAEQIAPPIRVPKILRRHAMRLHLAAAGIDSR